MSSAGFVASVVIPAHNEEARIGICLATLLRDSVPGEFEVVVVANGCEDGTAAVARSVDRGVKVVETPVARKTAALNLGDDVASTFPRIYLDADVLLDTNSARLVVRALEAGPALAAAPGIRVDVSSSSWVVRQYYRVWTSMAWVGASMIGSGVYALSAEGRDRFGPFPDVLAEDYWLSGQFGMQERLSVPGARFTVRAAPDLRTLVRRKARILAYNRLIDAEIESSPGEVPTRGKGIFGAVRNDPSLCVPAILYVLIAVVSNAWAAIKVKRGSLEWVSDR